MSVLRIRCRLGEPPSRCDWALLGASGAPVAGAGRLAELPRPAGRVQLLLPAADVLLTRARLPQAAKRRAGAVLSYAVEEETLGEPEASQVSWLGREDGADALAVIDRAGLARWHEALEAAGIGGYELQCETLLLPIAAGEWSFAWDGREGFVRSGRFEGIATDSGDRIEPPLALRMMVDRAHERGRAPSAIALYPSVPDAAPDLETWQRALGVPLRAAGAWDWRAAAPDAGVVLAQSRRRLMPGLLSRLRPAAWIAGAALAVHALALGADWASLASEQRDLRARMVVRFRAVFPDAVAVVDPALQMRRKLAEARHAAGRADPGDFLPMIGQVAAALGDLPPGGLKVVSYAGGRMTLELAPAQADAARRAVGRLKEAGLAAEAIPRGAGGAVVMTVRVR